MKVIELYNKLKSFPKDTLCGTYTFSYSDYGYALHYGYFTQPYTVEHLLDDFKNIDEEHLNENVKIDIEDGFVYTDLIDIVLIKNKVIFVDNVYK